MRLLRDTPPALHSAIIAAASTDEARFALSREPLVGRTEAGDGADAFARDLSIALGVAPGRVNVAPLQHAQPHEYDHDDGGVHWFAASMSIGGGHWLNVTERPPVVPPWGLTFVLLFMLSALAVAGVAVLMGLWISKPLKSLAAAEDRLGRGEEVDDLPETGPLELQSAARAFNLMHGRLERYVRDRTAMLAAVSARSADPDHEPSPSGRVGRGQEFQDEAPAALAEMQRMTEDTLAFIREDAQREETRTVDLHALIDSVAADLADLGMNSQCSTPAGCWSHAGLWRCAAHSATFWRTRAPMASAQRRRLLPTTDVCASSSRTTDRVFPTPIWSGCSSPSSGSTRHGAGTRAARAWALPSHGPSSAATVGTSGWRIVPKED